MAIKLKSTTNNINLKPNSQAIKGDDGGYYIPSVDADGVLTWIPSESDMPEVEAAAIKGPKGDKGETGAEGKTGPAGEKGDRGESGVYLGTTPPEDAQVWINPDGEIETELATKEYVDNAIANVEAGEGTQGPQGEQGPPGEPGKDGYTPVRGVDYWTAADKQEIINDVLEALPAAESVSV